MKTTLYFLLTLVLLTATSCTVDVPDTDAVAPKFSFQIRGDSFNHTFESEDDFDNMKLHLRDGFTYNFTFSGGDSGGLKNLRWLWFDSLSGSVTTDVAPASITEGWLVRTGYIWFIGDRDNALSGAIITGKFTPHGGYPAGEMQFEFFADDFGGQRGDENYTEKYLNVVIANHPTKIVTVN